MKEDLWVGIISDESVQGQMTETEVQALIKELCASGFRRFITGVGNTGEILSAEVVETIKQEYPGIFLTCVIACETQADEWEENLRDRFFSVMEHCDKEVLLQTHATEDCFEKQRQYIMEKAAVIVKLHYNP